MLGAHGRWEARSEGKWSPVDPPGKDEGGQYVLRNVRLLPSVVAESSRDRLRVAMEAGDPIGGIAVWEELQWEQAPDRPENYLVFDSSGHLAPPAHRDLSFVGAASYPRQGAASPHCCLGY
jgi:hypothetical protein